MSYAPYASAAKLEQELGDPEDAGRILSYARCRAFDDSEMFPLEMCRELDRLGLPANYVPVEYGGTLRGYDEALQLMRVVARRDLTVAIAHGKTFLGAVSVWTGAEPDQAKQLGAAIVDRAVVSWGLTEREHGGDLLAVEARAVRGADGYRLSGEKWLINNASRAHLVCLLVRTSDEGGPRDHSVLLVDKRALAPGSFRPLPGVRLHGIRGADISGIAFTDAEVPASALVGPEGGGLETVLKSLLITRTMCASLSLGAGDQALEMAVHYACERRNYDRLLVDLPQTRRLIAHSYADLLLAEALTLVTARAIHTLTGEMAVLSAVVKYFVPSAVDEVIGRLAKVMGSRSLLADETYRHGRYQKVQRDHRIVGIFDGSSVVNLHALINHFAVLARGYQRGRVDEPGLAAAATLGAELPEFDRSRLEVFALTGSSVLQSLPAATEEIKALVQAGQAPDSLGVLVESLRAYVDGLCARLGQCRPAPVNVPASSFALAKQYAAACAGAAAVQLWLRNRTAAEGLGDRALWESGLWLEASLTSLLRRLTPHERLTATARAAEADVYGRLILQLLEQHAAGRSASILSYPSEEAE